MIIYLVMVLLIVAADQISKIAVASSFKLGEQKMIIDNVLSFTYVQNKGAAFGILQGARVFFLVLTAVMLIAAIIYIIKVRPQSKLEKTALSFIAGGALGNVIDRAMLGYVRDFIATEFMDFPVFNIADCFVCIGAGLYILYALLDFSHSEEKI